MAIFYYQMEIQINIPGKMHLIKKSHFARESRLPLPGTRNYAYLLKILRIGKRQTTKENIYAELRVIK